MRASMSSVLLRVLCASLLIRQCSGDRERIEVMGRAAYVYRPRTMPSQQHHSAPKAGIFVLHGSAVDASDMFNLGFEAESDARGFLLVYPEMETLYADEWGIMKNGKYEVKADIPYFEALIRRLEAPDFGLDPVGKGVFVCGHSAGGSMSLFLQNEMDIFRAGGAVEAAPGNLDQWTMSKTGKRTMVVWNHADPVLHKYAPPGGEPAYFAQMVSTLRRHGSVHIYSTVDLPTSEVVIKANLLRYPRDEAPELFILSYTSLPGTHEWAKTPNMTFHATKELVDFFLGDNIMQMARLEHVPPSPRFQVAASAHSVSPHFLAMSSATAAGSASFAAGMVLGVSALGLAAVISKRRRSINPPTQLLG